MTHRSAHHTVPALERIACDIALQRLADEWDELLADSAAPTIFLTWAWVDAWRSTIGTDCALASVAARDPATGRLLGVAPFVIDERAHPQRPAHRALSFIGSGMAAPDHLDLVVRRGHEAVVAPALWAAASRQADADVHDFDGVRDGSLLAAAALRRADDLPRFAKPAPCPFIELPETWEAYEGSLGRHLRHSLRRHARKLERDADGRSSCRLATEPEDVEATISALGRFHEQGGRLLRDFPGLHIPELAEFHRRVALRFAQSGRLRLYRLDVGDDVAAIVYCLRYGDTVSLCHAGYDSTFARYGPGRHLIAHAIGASIAEGAAEFDLLRGDEEHKSRWANRVRHDLRILKPASTKGRMLLGLRAALRPLTRAHRAISRKSA
jgi:CelD/BcsL family acetyltransferase involved in cellulose biosynthesis